MAASQDGRSGVEGLAIWQFQSMESEWIHRLPGPVRVDGPHQSYCSAAELPDDQGG